ncbi:SMP-30/gluconolactonase/LRE family protein [Rhodoferax sp. UBA5149]|uniref:SMP-30/gluconolactonase/LRE family protein n=1 Tax=Rhodoferax sp. UBA5149 TaxID=1947379 RepID=UPI0025ED0BC1|nr:SMP-30/gluconolactonase/LRE family protein [Rhodoferax sp. UBA5149]
MTTESILTPFLDQLAFPESPRWHDGALWFSDFYTHSVKRVGMDGRVETVVEVPGQPSGLGWLPDGRLLVVSMTDRRLLRLDPQGLTEVADLSHLAPFHCNDMVVDALGRAYIGNFGFDIAARQKPVPTVLIMVTPDAQASVVADDLQFPNGSVITPDGRTLIVAESYGARLTAFTIGADGTLGERRVWAQLQGAAPDGICLDAQGAVWVASPISREVLRVREGGEVTHRIPTLGQAVACMLGGPQRKTLFVLTGKVMLTPEQSRLALSGMIFTMPVDVPGVGLP